jgi:WD40 repeat protein/tRNA A-37 threonylcarbamoyl transferase component Bud32
MSLSSLQMARMSRLLDDALELDEVGRRRWLENLADEYRDLALALREALLPKSVGPPLAEKLATLPKFGAGDSTSGGAVSGLQPGERVGPYELIRLLGVGGMAEVWLARRADGTFKREVALKIPLLTRLRRDLEQRFAREREILASLNHPNIARLFDAGFTHDGQSYLALEYVDGTPLTSYCDARKLPLAARLELFRQVLSAVQYAHANLVIHRDLKPSNILVTAAGEVRLLDFGIAKLLTAGEAKETELTLLSGRAMTPDYAAPEQVIGAPITTAADVYALGVMLYELLTGERPYRLTRDSRGALEEAILQAEPALPSRLLISEPAAGVRASSAKKLTKALRGDLDTIVMKALKKSPDERYVTAAAFGEDIARFLTGQVVLAQPDSLAYRAFKFARRHRLGIAVVGILLVTLAGGLAATSYEARVAARQRDAAIQSQLRSLTQTAAARLKDGDLPDAMRIILEVLRRGGRQPDSPEALNVFQEALAADRQILATVAASRLWSAEFSPDGSRFVTASNDNTARTWDATSGRQIMQFSGHTDRVICAAFSPDGRYVVTGSADKTARLWEAETGREVLRFIGHTNRVEAARFSHDGRRVITASLDRTVRLWDAATGRALLLLSGHTDGIWSAAFSRDDTLIVTASDDATARVWDAATGRQLQTLTGHSGPVLSAAFSPTADRIATASDDRTARIWDRASNQALVWLGGHQARLQSVRFSPDGRQVLTAASDETARIWDAASGQQLELLSGHTAGVQTATYSENGRRIITASQDGTARTWEPTSYRMIRRLSGHALAVTTVAYSQDGRRIVSGSDDRTARIWDAATGEELVAMRGHSDMVWSAAFSADGRYVVTASLDGTARIWDAAQGRELTVLSGHTAGVESAAFAPDGRRIVTASDDRTARIWDVATGRELMRLGGHADRLTSAAFAPDGRRIVTSSGDRTARIWDANTGQQVTLLVGHAAAVISAAFSPDGRRIVTTSSDKTVRIWDAASGREMTRMSGPAGALVSGAFSPDGRLVLATSVDKTARIWDAATGKQLLSLSGHADRVLSAAFSPDGRRVVTASTDRTVSIWNADIVAVEKQIAWADAAQFEPLSGTERFVLGLPAPTDVRQWSADHSPCDESAAAPYDPDRRAPGVMLEQLAVDIALAVCGDELAHSGTAARSLYQQGRALMASGKSTAARQAFERALAGGYRTAGIELGMLLVQPSAAKPDPAQAIAAYELAWRRKVSIAAFELGYVYEHGVRAAEGSAYLLAPDKTRAWLWYQRGADAGEPNALARLAARDDEAASAAGDAAAKNARLLVAFRYYAAAAERARSEDWPQDAWMTWRYRRASLARLLARAQMMDTVADAYEAVREQYDSRPVSLWRRVITLAGPD